MKHMKFFKSEKDQKLSISDLKNFMCFMMI